MGSTPNTGAGSSGVGFTNPGGGYGAGRFFGTGFIPGAVPTTIVRPGPLPNTPYGGLELGNLGKVLLAAAARTQAEKEADLVRNTVNQEYANAAQAGVSG